jgi:hypothetical protein
MRWVPILLLVMPAFAGCTLFPEPNGDDGADDNSTTSNSQDGNLTNGTVPPAPLPSIERKWADLGLATIRPGASLDDGSCTANFIFTSLDNQTVYIGTAAHCFSRDLNTQTNGCTAQLEAMGAKRSISGASKAGVLVYSSWHAMQASNETSTLCSDNDFALLQIDPADEGKVNPALWRYGGPTGTATQQDLYTGARVLSYGNSGTRPEDSALSPREGVVTVPGQGCAPRVVFPNPAIPGDSGSPVIMQTGLAMGIFVSIELAPLPGQGHVCLLDWVMTHAAKAGFPVRLATWDLLDDGLP